MFNKLRTIVYHVDDLERAKQWYKTITGINPYFDEPFYVGFDINGCELGLDPDMTGIQAGNQSVAYWSVDDIASAVERLSVSHAVIATPVTEVGGGIKVATLRDPFGNIIGLIEGA